MPLESDEVLRVDGLRTCKKLVQLDSQDFVQLLRSVINPELASQVFGDDVAYVLSLEGLGRFVFLGEEAGQVLPSQF